MGKPWRRRRYVYMYTYIPYIHTYIHTHPIQALPTYLPTYLPPLQVGDATILPIVGLISGVFDPFMGPYIDLEKRNMEEMLTKAVEEDRVDR